MARINGRLRALIVFVVAAMVLVLVVVAGASMQQQAQVSDFTAKGLAPWPACPPACWWDWRRRGLRP